ncbi:hypothetical protein [Kocuria flava]|uniref:hypothetical protein n=1 Tax=Kocuria flava TaxID=446860 RepID=UPI0011BDA963|nr:hypothetical protein [Kocuria flava]
MIDDDIEIDKLRAKATSVATDVTDDDLAQRSLEAVLEQLINAHGPQLIVLDVGDRYYEQRGNRFTLKYPFRGDLNLLMKVSPVVNQGSSSGGQSSAEIECDISDQFDGDFTDQLARFLAWLDEQIIRDVQVANERLERRQAVFAEALRTGLQPRWTTTRALRGAMELLQVPLSRPKRDRVEVSLHPAPLSMRVLEQAAAAGAPQWTLAEDMAESVVETIASFSRALERLPGTAERLLSQNEETLRDVLLFVLNANFQGRVTGETFIGQGKSDLLLRWEDRDAFVGECKIWKGAKALSEGLDQLLERYTLWRHSRIALIVFIRDPRDATSVIDSAHTTVRKHRRTQSVINAGEPTRRSDYQVIASGDEKRLAHLTFLPVVIG